MPETRNGVFPTGPPLWAVEGGKRRLLEGDCPQFMAEDHRKGKGVDLGERHELLALRGTLWFPPCPGGLETTPLQLFRALLVHTREVS